MQLQASAPALHNDGGFSALTSDKVELCGARATLAGNLLRSLAT
jgi:hypothetical protein